MPRTSSQILEFAKRGAEYRYRELSEELSSLVRQFPHLRTLSARRRRRAATLDGIEVPRADSTPVRHRRRMSAASRAAISAAQKKRWAAIKRKRAVSER